MDKSSESKILRGERYMSVKVKSRIGIWLSLTMALVLIVSACGPAEAPAAEEAAGLSGTVSIAGSTTVQSLAEATAKAFMEMYPDVTIDVQGGGSSVGVKSAGEGTTDIGNASREVKDSELETYTDLEIFTIARDGIAITVHPDVDIDDVTMDQVRQIFTGEITNWSELGGSDQAIYVVAREEGSGTRDAFEEIVMGDSLIADTAVLQPSNGSVKTTVSTTEWSVGFLSMGYLDDTVKALMVDGVEANSANAAAGDYPVVRPLNMLTNGAPGELVQAYLDFVLSDEGQQIAVDEGWIAVAGAPYEAYSQGGSDAAEEAAEETLSGTLSIAGSTTVQPLAEAAVKVFMEMYPDVTVDVQGGGSSVGVKSAGEGTVDIGNASREVKESELAEFADLNIFVVARDGIAVAVHPSVDVDGVTMDQVRQLFAGEITNWSELGGSDQPIYVVAREEGSGTRSAFEEIVMGDSLIVDTAVLLPSNGAVKTTVSTTEWSVGFLSMGYLDSSVKALEVDGVAASAATAAAGEYPVVRPLNMMTNGEPTGLAKAFIDFVMSHDGQVIAALQGWIAVGDTYSGSVSIAGSTTVQPLAEAVAAKFSGIFPDVTIDVQGGGSSVGVKSAGEGTTDIGNASREIKESELTEFPDLQIYTVARDGIAIAAHPDVDVDDISMEDIMKVFSGEITNWSELGGSDQPIYVVAREEGSGTRAAFEEIVMGDALITDNAVLLPSNGAVKTTVSTTEWSVGFLSMGYLDDEVKGLEVDGVAATVENAASGDYPVVRPLNMLTSGEPSELTQAFLDYMLSEAGQEIATDQGWIPVE